MVIIKGEGVVLMHNHCVKHGTFSSQGSLSALFSHCRLQVSGLGYSNMSSEARGSHIKRIWIAQVTSHYQT